MLQVRHAAPWWWRCLYRLFHLNYLASARPFVRPFVCPRLFVFSTVLWPTTYFSVFSFMFFYRPYLGKYIMINPSSVKIFLYEPKDQIFFFLFEIILNILPLSVRGSTSESDVYRRRYRRGILTSKVNPRPVGLRIPLRPPPWLFVVNHTLRLLFGQFSLYLHLSLYTLEGIL